MLSVELDNGKSLNICKYNHNRFIVDLYDTNGKREFRTLIIADEFFHWVNRLNPKKTKLT